MTAIGKLFVLLNGVFSLLGLGVALLMWSNSVDYPEFSDKGPAEPERVKKLQAKINSMARVRDKAWEGRQKAYYPYIELEKYRPEYLALYAKELDGIRLPGDGGAERKLYELERESGKVKLDLASPAPKAVPKSANAIKFLDKDLQPAAVYLKDYEESQKKLAEIQEDIKSLLDEQKKLTEEIYGIPEMKIKGLRDLLREQQYFVQASRQEQEYLEPVRLRSVVDVRSLEARRERLEMRLKELKQVTASISRGGAQ